MPDNKSIHPRHSRRTFLTLAGSALAAGVAGKMLIKGDAPNLQQPATESPHMTQRKINAAYVKLYKEVKDAKNQADEAGKKLLICAPSRDGDITALLTSLMLQDIARRLSIHTVLVECDTLPMDEQLQQAQILLSARDKETDFNRRESSYDEFLSRAYMANILKSAKPTNQIAYLAVAKDYDMDLQPLTALSNTHYAITIAESSRLETARKECGDSNDLILLEISHPEIRLEDAGTAFAMVLKASAAHKRDLNEIDRQQASDEIHGVDKAIAFGQIAGKAR